MNNGEKFTHTPHNENSRRKTPLELLAESDYENIALFFEESQRLFKKRVNNYLTTPDSKSRTIEEIAKLFDEDYYHLSPRLRKHYITTRLKK